MVYQLLKQGVPVAVVNSVEECDELYLKYDCDEVRELDLGELNENQK